MVVSCELADVLDALPEGLQVVDRAYRYLYLNDAAVRHGRTTRAALLGRTMMECYPGIEHTEVFALLRRTMEDRTSHILPNIFTFPDGSVGHFELRLRPVPEGACLLSVDVTEQRSAELARLEEKRALRLTIEAELGVESASRRRAEEAERVLTALAERAPVVLWALRAESAEPGDLRLLFGNPAARRFAPYVAAGIGKTLAEIDPALAQAPMVPAILRAALARQASSLPEVATTAGALVQAEIFPFGDRSVGVVLQDVTAARRAAEALARVNEDLESFSYSVSHDLRAPLRAISGFASALEEDHAAQLDGPARDYLARIRAAAARMGELIDDLLDLSRMTRATLQPTGVDATAMARSIVADLRRDAGGETEVSIEEGMRVWADPRLLRVALENLLGNAWKFTRKASAPRIEVGVERAPGTSSIVVRDNGAGFDPTYASKLFGVFQRLHSPKDFPGTGVGLATVQRIAHKHGGAVQAEGAPDRGATFRLRLPDGLGAHGGDRP